MLCLMAVRAGSTNCENGFPVLSSFLVRAHVDPTQIVLTDGHGGPNDRFTPQAVTDMLHYWIGQPEFAEFRQMLPILGEHGNLARLFRKLYTRGHPGGKQRPIVSGWRA